MRGRVSHAAGPEPSSRARGGPITCHEAIRLPEKGKPLARAARKATGLTEPAGLPTMSTKVRILIIALFAAALAVAPPAAGAHSKHRNAVARAAQECPDAGLEPAAGNLARIRAAVLCLHNEIRSQYHLPRLREHRRLRKAAVGHSRDMVRARYFEHTAPSGRTMIDRILAARYVREDHGWMLGENLEWGTGSLATPRGAMAGWMRSPGHRANILRRSFRELGVGVVIGVPVSDALGATYTIDFGVRR